MVAPTSPHLHLNAQLIVPMMAGALERLSLDKRHLPTGCVSLPAVVRMLIAEFGAQPRPPVWQARLTAADAAFAPSPAGGRTCDS